MPNEGMKISQLPAATEVLDSDVLAGVGGGVTRKFTFATIASYIRTKLSSFFDAKQDKITANGVLQGDGNGGVTARNVDATPTASSTALITSGGVKSALDDKQDEITANGVLQGDGAGGITAKTVDSAPDSAHTNNLISSAAVAEAIAAAGIGAAYAGYHNSIYRGKDLGSSVSAAQQAAIVAGTFDDMFIGDYWTIGGTSWRIAHFNYWRDATNSDQLPNHVVIVRNIPRSGSKMNNSPTTAGGYLGSDFYTGNNSNTARADMIAEVETAFGSANLLTHKEYFTNAVTDGKSSGSASADSKVDLLNEYMVYGAPVWGISPYEAETDWQQLALFKLSRERAVYRSRSYWLRTVANGTSFAVVNFNQRASCDSASTTNRGIRPVFAIQFG